MNYASLTDVIESIIMRRVDWCDRSAEPILLVVEPSRDLAKAEIVAAIRDTGHNPEAVLCLTDEIRDHVPSIDANALIIDNAITLTGPCPPAPKPPRRNRAQRRADARAQVTRDRKRSRVRQSRREAL